jgi:hypothetical protein
MFLWRYRTGKGFFWIMFWSLFNGGYAYRERRFLKDGTFIWADPYPRPKWLSWVRRLEVGLVNLIHGTCPFLDIDEGERFYFLSLRYRKNWAKETFWFLTPRGTTTTLPTS